MVARRPEKKRRESDDKRKAHGRPRPAILRLAQQLDEDARRSGRRTDLEVAALVSRAWLLDVGARGQGTAARQIDGAHAFERATPRPQPTPAEWLESVQASASKHFGLLKRADGQRERLVVRRLVASQLTEFVLASVPGLQIGPRCPSCHESAATRLLVRLDGEMPVTAVALARWALKACGVAGTRVNEADARTRQRARRATEKK
jgi:hypothetical protein